MTVMSKHRSCPLVPAKGMSRSAGFFLKASLVTGGVGIDQDLNVNLISEPLSNILTPMTEGDHDCSVCNKQGQILKSFCLVARFGLNSILCMTLHYCEIDNSRSGTAPSCHTAESESVIHM